MANEIRVTISGEDDLSKAVKTAVDKAEGSLDELGAAARKVGDRVDRDLNESFDNLGEGAGTAEQKFIGLADTLNGTKDVMQGLRDGDVATLAMGLADLSGAVEALWSSVGKAVTSLWAKVTASTAEAAATTTSTTATIGHRIATLASEAASKAMAAAQWALNAAMSANPIALVVIALAALAAGFYFAYNNIGWFRDAVDAVWGFIKNNLWPILQTVGGFIAGVFAQQIRFGIDMFQWLYDKIVLVYNFIKDLPGNISAAASGMFDGIKNAFRSAVNWIIDSWNNLSFSLPSIDTKIPGIGKVGGFTLSTPNIPRLAKGGITTGPMMAIIGDNPSGREAVVPLDGNTKLGGDTYYITVQALDSRGAAEAVTKAMRDAKRYGLTSVSI